MRSLLCLAALAACGGPRKPAPERVEYDPELAEACVPDRGDEASAALCEKGDDGKWILPEDDPDRKVIFQVLALQENHRGRSVDEAVVQLTSGIVRRNAAPTCGVQMARWHRALASFRLGAWKQAFLDFGSIVRDGPNNPYYAYADDWLAQLEERLPAGAVATCLVSYVPYAVEAAP